jgi:type II secretory pathway component PulK
MRQRKRERGVALIWALVLLFFAASLSALLLERGRTVDAASKTDLAALQARYAAEGGIALARHRLATEPTYAGETVRVGEYDVTITVAPREGGWLVRSAAGAATVAAALRAAPGLPAINADPAAGR